MRIAVAADHAGYLLKSVVLEQLTSLGHQAVDLGTFDPTLPDDYPDFAEAVAGCLIRGDARRGVLICGSGVGASVAANKFPGIRAAVCHDTYSAHQGVEHDDLNVLCLGARIIGSELAAEIVRAWAAAEFSNADRHRRRLKKVIAFEQRLIGASRTTEEAV